MAWIYSTSAKVYVHPASKHHEHVECLEQNNIAMPPQRVALRELAVNRVTRTELSNELKQRVFTKACDGLTER